MVLIGGAVAGGKGRWCTKHNMSRPWPALPDQDQDVHEQAFSARHLLQITSHSIVYCKLRQVLNQFKREHDPKYVTTRGRLLL